MKKILSIAVVLVLVLALAAPAFASGEPTNEFVTSVDSGVATVDVAVGYTVEVTEIGRDGLDDAADKSLDKELESIDVAGEPIVLNIDVLDRDGNVTEKGAKVVFAYDAQGDVAAVLHYKDGKWESVSFTGGKNGEPVEFTLDSTSPVAIVLGEKKASPAGGNGSSNKKSPQTGYNTALWTIAAAAMAICAGACFVSARRKVAE